MAVPVRLQNVPEYLRSSQFTNYSKASSRNQVNESQELLQFPKSTCVLWDGTSTGSPVFLHVAQNRKPQLLLWEKLLWLIHKQVGTDGSSNKVLVGSLAIDQDAEGVSFKIDRLDTCQTDLSASLLQDDVMIPVQISTNNNQEKTGSRDDYAEAIKMLEKRCSSHESLELNNLLLMKGWCSVRCHQHQEKVVAHMHFDLVTLGSVFKATPVNPVPVIPSALAKNLVGPRSLSHMQGRPKMGYLSMDATRKVLLVLESDPKVASLPVVGIWVSGVSMVHHPFVWGACIRYLHNDRLQDRVCTPPEGFLLMVYSTAHSSPQFYEINTTSGKSDHQYDLYTGYEVTTLSKKSSGLEPGALEWELCPVRNGPKREMFDAALESVKAQSRQGAGSGTAKTCSSSTQEDIMPRMTPAPHQSKTMTIRPMVPEVSMLWNDNSPAPDPLPFSSSASPGHTTAFTDARSAAGPSDRQSLGFVPSSHNTCPTCSAVTSSGAQTCGKPADFSHPDSDCFPRASVPAQFQHPPAGFSQNSQARTCVSSSVPSGGWGSASNNRLPQAAAAAVWQPFSGSQAGSDDYSNVAAVPSYSAQGQGAPTPTPLQQMYSQGGVNPRGQLRPRLTAAGVHFCPPSQGGPAGRPFPHPSLGVPRPPPSSTPAPSQGQQYVQQQQGGVSTPFPHPHPRCPPHPGHRPPHPDFVPQAAPPHLPMMPNTSVPSYVSSAQGMAAPPPSSSLSQGAPPHAQRTETAPSPGHRNGAGPCDWPRGNPPPAFPPAQTQPDAQSGVASYAQMMAGKLQPCHAPQGLVPSEGYVPLVAQHLVSTCPAGNDSHQSDSTTSSAKSSDDSGLSVTPDRSNPSLKLSGSAGPPYPPPQSKVGGEGPAPLPLASVNWAGVPSEVVQLLVQQDAQLRLLQSQIQQLLQQQQQQQQRPPLPSPASDVSSTPTSVAASSPTTLTRETCSRAVNTTTLLDAGLPWVVPGQCVSVQTSPQKPQSASPHPHRQSPATPAHSQDPPHYPHRPPALMEGGERAHTPARWEEEGEEEGGISVGETPSELRHQGLPQLSSTEREENPGKVHSVHSTGSGEHPSPVRSVESHLQLSNSTPSPLSASMCVRPDESEEEQSGQEISPVSKEYYDQLINNIRLFLNSHSQDAADNTEATTTDGDTVTATHDDTNTAGLKMFDSTMQGSPGMPATPSGGASSSSSNTTLMPHINYLSMMLESDTDVSLEINAMAMKYLRDEQLTQVARRCHQSPHRAHPPAPHLLRQALAASLDATGASDISRMGMSATNLSMATKRYLEKHGLLGAGQADSLLDTNHTIRLQTDFSLAAMSDSHPSMPPSPQPQPPGAQSPVKREVLKPPFRQPSPGIVQERGDVRGESERRQFGDLGASPVLRPPRHYIRDSSPEDSPMFPERYRGPPQQPRLISDCSLATEDDRILDIEKLKQLPKLL